MSSVTKWKSSYHKFLVAWLSIGLLARAALVQGLLLHDVDNSDLRHEVGSIAHAHVIALTLSEDRSLFQDKP